MNQSFVVATMYRCDEITQGQFHLLVYLVWEIGLESYRPDQTWRTTALGCKILELLQLMYNFQMTYVNGCTLWGEDTFGYPNHYVAPPDIYASPLAFTRLHKHASPTVSVINRRYGFVLISPKEPMPVKTFFTRPFTLLTWVYILTMAFLILAPAFYFLGRWEKMVLKKNQEYSVTFSLLTVIGACFQHTPPVHTKLCSHRIVYFTLLLFTYILHAFYTSNLLSHLVNDKEKDTTLAQLVDSDYKFVTLDTLRIESSNYSSMYLFTKLRRFSRIQKLREKLASMRSMSVFGALETLKTEKKIALLSDYVTINPYLKEVLDPEVTCDLVEVDLITNIQQYVFTANTFPLHEKFKVGILRIIETGVLRRVMHDHVYGSPHCHAAPEPRVSFEDVTGCLVLLPCAAAAATCILAAEIRLGRRRWPYLD